MSAWWKPFSIFGRRRMWLILGYLTTSVVILTTLFLVLSAAAHAAVGINPTINFQGRLLTSTGAVVPDGYYNIEFKIYQDGDGTTAGDTGGTLKWTEDYINNGGTSGVQVTNGFLSVNLGSITAFGTSIDWNQDTLWLSMNVAGTATTCTAFGTGTCLADGEMLPMKRLTSTPYSLNSGLLGGKSAGNFTQLGQGLQTDASNNSSIYINKTGTGNIAQFQNAATDVFTISNAGDLSLGSNAAHNISVAASASNIVGKQLTLAAGSGGSGTGAGGGTLTLRGGDAGGTNGNGGNLELYGGNGTGTGVDGVVQIGSGSDDGHTTVLTLDQAASAPTSTIPGSMYYNTTLGRVQCYQTGGWGDCTNRPDVYVDLAPSYSGAVDSGSSLGTLSTGFCSGSLAINDGSNSQPSVCGSTETANYYHWTSSETTAQTRDIFVTYKLPADFKSFVSGSTSLLAKTDSTDASAVYQIYRKNGTGLTACGGSTSVSTGVQTTWQSVAAINHAGGDDDDPADCSFVAGDSIVFKITLSSMNSANAYLSDLDFAYSNN